MNKLLTALVLLCCFSATAQDTAKTTSKLTTATVYYGYGAELTHESRVNVNSGIKQIVINQLSTAVDVNSLQISVPDNVALLSHKYTIYYPTAVAVKNPLTKKMQDTVVLINTELRKNRNLTYIEEQTLEKTGRLVETVIANSGNKTVSAEDALKLISAYTAKIEKARTNIFNLKEAEMLINSRLTALYERIQQAAGVPEEPGKPYGQLILQVLCKNSGEIPVSFSYFTKNAGWVPLYDIKVNAKTNEIKLVYKASVTQTTGIDWKQTKLTLSTSNPNLNGAAPLLTAWYLQLYQPQVYNQMLEGKVSGLAVQNTIQSFNDDKSLSEVVVTTANGIERQKKDLGYATSTITPSTLQQYTSLNESQLNTNFEIDLPYDIESNGQVHAVTIKDEKINASLKNYAVPKLDRDAYLLAEVSDWQNLNLLPGTANIIMDNTYIGKSYIDPNSTADTLNLSLGKDRRLAIKRDLLKDFTSTKTNGNTTRQTFTYELTVKNNKVTSVDMLLKDQYPISMVKDIEIKLEDGSNAAVNEETGILTWKIQLKPGESKKVRFSYTVKYPKDKRIANL
ncbi:DUF4139 domain-containing protein [Ferruginibacter sp. HRS2-29]|uniref:DUF4139 domain-containing protein n=1 Tax=Ferruginibacter sp. HRS2-29 TaxID=2487334 RepID=UPI0020CB70C0|nr:DUF4139 domain-containing protein [Ferruginibacter sp. HRS2-29]MCP9750419.1 mucoidy inhibitor MuiA family protein [Ferruginibacter sp. HRS2-29]